jgi:hypothetical protein
MYRTSISHVALVVALASSAGFARAEQIGTTTAVIPDAKSRPMGGGERLLTMGTSMTGHERITTGAAGRTQILFIDGSAINVGPSSSLVLDEYVFDPRTGSGKLAVTLGKGAMRFVGGKISKSETVTIATPVATVGIRGGIATVDYSPESGVTARLLFGDSLSVSAGGVTSTTNRPGTAIDRRPGSQPSPPRTMSASEVAQSTSQTTGGASRSPPPGPATDSGSNSNAAAAAGGGAASGGLQGGIASGAPVTEGQPRAPVTQPPPPPPPKTQLSPTPR